MLRYLIAVGASVLLVMLSISVGECQTGISSDGREFYVGVVLPSLMRQPLVFHDSVPVYTPRIFITSSVDNTVNVSYFGSGGEVTGETTLRIQAGKTAVYIPDLSMLRISDAAGESVQFGCCHITATAPLSVAFVSGGTCTGGSYQALPVQCWGKKYVVQSYQDNPNGTGGYLNTEGSRGFFQIIASENGTQVTLTPSTTTAGGRPGAYNGAGSNGSPQQFTIGMSKGQIYTVYSSGQDQGFDLTGSVISSTKPIAVLGGHENAFTTGSSEDMFYSEGRDYMIEQLIPVECWDTTGMFSIPFVDSSPATAAGYGDELRVVTLPANGNSVQASDGSSVNGMLVPSYSSSSRGGVTVPVGFNDVNGKPFGVMQYDLRMQGSKAPYPAPSMLSIIPRSRWKSEYYFYNPSTKNLRVAMYLILILPKVDWSNQRILASHDGGQMSTLVSSGFGVKHVWNVIPGDTSIMGVVLTVNNFGSYHLVDVGASKDPKFHGTFGAAVQSPVVQGNSYLSYPPYYTDVAFEYANPLGMNFGTFGLRKPQMKATVKNNCGGWDVCVTDSGATGNGIRYIELVNYPKAAYTTAITPSKNSRFDPTIDPLGKGEIVLPGTDGAFCFSVAPVNPAETSIAVIEIYDNSGASILLNLSASTTLATDASGVLGKVSGNIFSYGTHTVDSLLCGTLTITNPIVTGGKDFLIDSLRLLGDTTHFKLNGALPSFPMFLHQGASLQIPICFHPDDTATFRSSVSVYSECGQGFSYLVTGNGASPILRAGDITFAPTDSADTQCDTLSLRNTGSQPLVINRGSVLSDSVNFYFTKYFLDQLPLTIPPGGSATAYLCFKPTDHNSHVATVTWNTNMHLTSALENHSKIVSKLNGQGYNPGVVFIPSGLMLVADSTATKVEATERIYLANHGTTKSINVNLMSIAGTDSSEFVISDEEFGLLSGIHLNPGDSTWFAVTFRPDITKPYPDRYATRTAVLACNFAVENSSTTNSLVVASLAGTFNGESASVRAYAPNEATFTPFFTPNELVIRQEAVHEGEAQCELFDLLGRSVYSSSALYWPPDKHDLIVPVGHIPSGAYLVRIKSGAREEGRLVVKVE